MYNEIIFFISRKSNILRTKYLDSCVSVNHQTSKSVTLSWTLMHSRSYSFSCFFKVLSSIKIKPGQKYYHIWQTLLFWGYCNTLLNTMKNTIILIQCNLFIFTKWRLVFASFGANIQQNQNLQSHHDWFLTNYSRLVDWKVLWFRDQFSKLCKTFLRVFTHEYIY